MANGICDGSCLCIRSITMRRVHTLGWRRTRRYDEPSNDLGPLSPHQSCLAYIIDTRGYDSRQGQVCQSEQGGQGIVGNLATEREALKRVLFVLRFPTSERQSRSLNTSWRWGVRSPDQRLPDS